MTDQELEDLVVAAWNWARYMSDGSLPPEPEYGFDIAQLHAFALGRFGPDGLERIQARLNPRVHIDRPWDLPVPQRYTWAHVEAAVRT